MTPLENDHGNRDSVEMADDGDAGTMHDVNIIDQTRTPVISDGSQHIRLQSAQEAWPPQPIADVEADVSTPDGLNLGGLSTNTGQSSSQSSFGDVSRVATGDIPHSSSSTGSSRTSLGTNEFRASSRRSEHPTPPFNSNSSQGNTTEEIRRRMGKDSVQTNALVQVFFSDIHQHWPILHVPTFDIANASEVLLGSMVMLASWLRGGSEHKELAPLVFNAVAHFQLDLQPQLQLLQAVVLCVVYATHCLTGEGMLARALSLSAALVATCRYLGIFNGQYAYHDPNDCQFVLWRSQEQLNRLAFAVLRIDTYLSVLLDHPPLVRYQELCIPLPKSDQLWAANTEEERRRLQWNEPVGREKALFSFLMRDGLDTEKPDQLPYPLLDFDRHIGICATQTIVWETAREAHSSMSDELATQSQSIVNPDSERPFFSGWHNTFKKKCRIREYFHLARTSSNNRTLAAMTLMLWHVSALKIHAPMNILRVQGYYYKSRPGAAIPTRTPRAHFFFWMSTSCPYIALWNAAQISNIFMTEAADPGSRTCLALNPLAIPGMLMSAVVTCSYAFQTRACATCTGRSSVSSIDLFGVEEEDDAGFVQWREEEGVATWGSSGIAVCKCQVGELAAWFREALASDTAAQMELVLFIAELSRE